MPALRTAKANSPKQRLTCGQKGLCYIVRAFGKQLETIQHSRNWLRGSTLPQKKSTSTSNIISRSSGNSHQQKWNTCQGFVSLLILASQPILIASACGLLINPLETYKQSGTVCVEGSVKSMFESVVRRCTKSLKAMTSRQAPAKMFMYAAITHCQGKITQRATCLVAFTILAPRRPT